MRRSRPPKVPKKKEPVSDSDSSVDILPATPPPSPPRRPSLSLSRITRSRSRPPEVPRVVQPEPVSEPVIAGPSSTRRSNRITARSFRSVGSGTRKVLAPDSSELDIQDQSRPGPSADAPKPKHRKVSPKTVGIRTNVKKRKRSPSPWRLNAVAFDPNRTVCPASDDESEDDSPQFEPKTAEDFHFLTILQYDVIAEKRPKYRNEILRDITTSTQRAKFIRLSIFKAFTILDDDCKTNAPIYMASITKIVEHILLAVDHFPHVFCRMRVKRRTRKKRPYVPDQSTLDEIEEFLLVFFRNVPHLLLHQKSENIKKQLVRVLTKVLNLIYFNYQPLFHVSIEIILSLIKIIDRKEHEFVLRQKFGGRQQFFETKVVMSALIMSNFTHLLDILKKHWYYMLHRCSTMAETYIMLLCSMWEKVEFKDKIMLIKYFPVPLPKSTLIMDSQAGRLFELMVNYSLTVQMDSPEFIIFFRRLGKAQYAHGRNESVSFCANSHKMLTIFLNSDLFLNSPLVLTKIALVKLWCQSNDYQKKDQKDDETRLKEGGIEHQFNGKFMHKLIYQIPFVLTSMDTLITRECVAGLDNVYNLRPDLKPNPDDVIDSDRRHVGPEVVLPDIRPALTMCEISRTWSAIISEWEKLVVPFYQSTEEALLIITREIMKLAGLVYARIIAQQTLDVVRRIKLGRINFIIFPFETLEIWAKLVPWILRRTGNNGRMRYLSMIMTSLSSLPPLAYDSKKLAFQEVQNAWLYYSSQVWMPKPIESVLKFPLWVFGGPGRWEPEVNVSEKKFDTLLKKCVDAVANKAISPTISTTMTILQYAMSSKLQGCTIGVLDLIGKKTDLIRRFPWQTLFKFVQNVVLERMWKDDDTMTVYLVKALAQLPCLMSSKEEEITNSDPYVLYKSFCRQCASVRYSKSNDCLGTIKDKLLLPDIDTAFTRLLQPIVFNCKHPQVLREALQILHTLKRHGRNPQNVLVATFLYHLSQPQFGLVPKLLYSLRDYLDHEKTWNDYSSDHLKGMEIIFTTLSVRIRKLKGRAGIKPLLNMFGPTGKFAKTKDYKLRVEIVKLIFVIMLSINNNAARGFCGRHLTALSEASKLPHDEVLYSVRFDVAEELVEYCLCQFFLPEVDPVVLPPATPSSASGPKSRRKKNTPKLNTPDPISVGNLQDLSDKERSASFHFKTFLERLTLLSGATAEAFMSYYVPPMLLYLIPSIREDRRRFVMIHSIANAMNVTIRSLLLEHFPVYFPMMVARHETTVITKVLALLDTQGVQTDLKNRNIYQCLIQKLMNEMLGHLSVNKDRVLMGFRSLPLWDEGETAPVLARTNEDVINIINSHIMGWYEFMDSKLHSRIETWETKRRILYSFGVLVGLIGPKHLAATTLKAFSTLKTFRHLGVEIEKSLCWTWVRFANGLDNPSFGATIRQILGSILAMNNSNYKEDAIRKIIEDMVRPMSARLGALMPIKDKFYFLAENYMASYPALDRLFGPILPANRLFDVLLDELRNNNTEVQNIALEKLYTFLSGKNSHFDLQGLFLSREDLQPQICKLVLGLMDITRSEDEKTRLLGGKCLGLVGASDNYRSMFKTLSDAQNCIGSDFNVALPGFAGRYLEQLRSLLEIVIQVQDFDNCAFCIQEILKLYEVEKSKSNVIWNSLSFETRILMGPLLQSKYTLNPDSSQTNINYPSPIYGSEYGRTYHNWLSNWMLQMISYMEPGTFHSKLFELSRAVIARHVKLATFLLPNVALHAIHDCPEAKVNIIKTEMDALLVRWSIPIPNFDKEETDFCSFMELENRLASKVRRQSDNVSEVQPLEEGTKPQANKRDMAIEFTDRKICTNAVLSVVDAVSTCVRVSKYLLPVAAPANANPAVEGPAQRPIPTPIHLPEAKTCRMSSITSSYKLLSEAAFRTGSYQRALLQIEAYLFNEPDKLQETLPYLQRIYVALKDVDGITGVAAVRKYAPTTLEMIMQKLAGGKDASVQLEQMVKEEPQNWSVRQSFMQSHLALDQPQLAYDLIKGYNLHEDTAGYLEVARAECCWTLGKWDELETVVRSSGMDKGNRWTYDVGDILVNLQKLLLEEAKDCIEDARKCVLNPMAVASLDVDAYHKLSVEVTRLHILAEMGQVADLLSYEDHHSSITGPLDELDIRLFQFAAGHLLTNWRDRRVGCHSSKILDPILNIRKVLLKIMIDHFGSHEWIIPMLENALKETWLHIAKAERKRGNFTRANNCIAKARVYNCPTVILEEVKSLSGFGSVDRAIAVIQRALEERTVDIRTWKLKVERKEEVSEEQCIYSKLVLLLAKYNHVQGNVGTTECVTNFTDALHLNNESEKNHFHLAFCYNRIYDAVESGDQPPDVELLTSGVLGVVRHYSQSLLYGCKYVYHSMPRLLSIWLDCKWSRLLERFLEAKKMDMKVRNDTQTEMTNLIKMLRQKIPVYIFFTAFSQLISRLCHTNNDILTVVKDIIAQILVAYPHQALWMTMFMYKSSYKMRKVRCQEVFNLAESRRADLKPLLRDYVLLTEKLIELSNKKELHTAKQGKVSVMSPTLTKLLAYPKLSKILIPFKRFLTFTLPREVGQLNHMKLNPFPLADVYIIGIQDTVQIMVSLQRPKRITFRGSNGQLYSVMCKPNDDLRKDSKVMEMNHVLNWYLDKDAESRQRQLNVRTFAVVPLNEQCGMIEWVPNLLGLRQITYSMYRRKGIDLMFMRSNEVQVVPGDGLVTKLTAFNKLLDRYTPVLAEWFQHNFPDPRVWYLARENYIRTAAVMSIFGYLMGLGDRHGENVLIDRISGEVVHVDFNCIFNAGDLFRWPEKVPFRLTQNMTKAMGILGHEGAFRHCCEITLRVLRSNASIFTSVLRPFAFDPLVEWSGKSKEAFSGTGEISNEKAWEHLKNFILRLEGKRRNNLKKVDLPLSVEAQVTYLIKEATDPENLCQMFAGWAGYL